MAEKSSEISASADRLRRRPLRNLNQWRDGIRLSFEYFPPRNQENENALLVAIAGGVELARRLDRSRAGDIDEGADALGTGIDEGRGDIELGPLLNLSGASTFEVPGDPGDRRNVWIYCKPFGVEMSIARLEDL